MFKTNFLSAVEDKNSKMWSKKSFAEHPALTCLLGKSQIVNFCQFMIYVRLKSSNLDPSSHETSKYVF